MMGSQEKAALSRPFSSPRCIDTSLSPRPTSYTPVPSPEAKKSIANLLYPSTPLRPFFVSSYHRCKGLRRLPTVPDTPTSVTQPQSPTNTLKWRQVLISTERLIPRTKELRNTVRNIFSRGSGRNPFARPAKGVLLLRKDQRPYSILRSRPRDDGKKLYDKSSRKVAYLHVTRLKTPRLSDCGFPISAWRQKHLDPSVECSFDDSTLLTSARYS